MAKLLNYPASNQHAEIKYRASGIQLAIYFDVPYLSVSKVRNRSSELHFLRKGLPNPNNPEYFIPTVNGILLVVWNIIRNIIASEAEAKYVTIFVNSQTCVPICTTLIEMGWKQGPMGIQVESSTAVGIATKEFRQKKSKAMDMRFYWTKNIIKLRQFRVFWRTSPENLENYHFKHHPPKHHLADWSKYIHVPQLISLQGCANLTIRVNRTKQESKWAQLQCYFLWCVS